MKTRITRVLAAAAVTLAVGTAATAQAQEAIRIGTSSLGSLFYTIAIGAGEIIQKYAKINTTIEPVGGSTASVRSLAAKKIEFAMANSFATFSAYRGRFQFKRPVELRLVVQGQPNYRSLVVRKDSGIKTPKDLVGKIIIGKRRALPEIEEVMNAIIAVYGLPKGSVKVVGTTNSPQAYKALAAGSVQGAIVPYSPRSAAIEKPLQDGLIEFVYIPDDKRDEMLKILPAAFYPATFKPGTLTGQDKPLNVFGLSTYFITRPDVPADQVERVAAAILDHTKEFATYHPSARLWTAKRTLENVKLPFHDGAIAYFKKKGLWTEALEKTQEALLQRR